MVAVRVVSASVSACSVWWDAVVLSRLPSWLQWHHKSLTLWVQSQSLFLRAFVDVYSCVCPQPVCRVTQRQLNITVQKKESNWWERLTKQEKRPLFLAPDFDRWLDESDAEMELREKVSAADMWGLCSQLQSNDSCSPARELVLFL